MKKLDILGYLCILIALGLMFTQLFAMRPNIVAFWIGVFLLIFGAIALDPDPPADGEG